MDEQKYFEQFAGATHVTYRVWIYSQSNYSYSQGFETIEEAQHEIESIKRSNSYPYEFFIVEYSDGIEYKRSQVA